MASHFYLRSKMLQEEWKPIKGYEGFYEISNFGKVKSLKREIICRNGMIKFVKEIILKSANDTKGYPIVILQNHGDKKTCKIHHLVWDNFSEKQRDGLELQIDHIDNNKRNNHIDNLRLVTNRENCSKGKLLIKNNGLPTGIYWYKRYKKYRAQIHINGKQRFIGYYKTIKQASEAYQNKRKQIMSRIVS